MLSRAHISVFHGQVLLSTTGELCLIPQRAAPASGPLLLRLPSSEQQSAATKKASPTLLQVENPSLHTLAGVSGQKFHYEGREGGRERRKN